MPYTFRNCIVNPISSQIQRRFGLEERELPSNGDQTDLCVCWELFGVGFVAPGRGALVTYQQCGHCGEKIQREWESRSLSLYIYIYRYTYISLYRECVEERASKTQLRETRKKVDMEREMESKRANNEKVRDIYIYTNTRDMCIYLYALAR